ncbi:MAG: hypothetical protein FJ317_09710 [SAR202 cluster bacterium]|nr:hypothetical protein [SAR202 cluster bacterium]
MPKITLSEENWKRLQKWAIPLEDSPDDAFRKMADTADLALQRGIPAPHLREDMNRRKSLDVQLTERLKADSRFSVRKIGATMTSWIHNPTGRGFGVTTNGRNVVFLPRKGQWDSDVDLKVLHTPEPKSGWSKADRIILKQPTDVEYVLKLIDADFPGLSQAA